MTHLDLALLQAHLNRRWQTKDTEIVSYSGSVFSNSLAHLLLSVVAHLHQILVSHRYFHCIQILSLDILHKSHLLHLIV